jgi:hypothetical protein
MIIPVENIPGFVPDLTAALLALFICAAMHVAIVSSRNRKKGGARKTEDPAINLVDCLEKLRDLAVTQETYVHPSLLGRKGSERLSQRLREASLFFPAEAGTLEALAAGLQESYEDEGARIMAMTRVHAWIREKLEKSGT